jgi:hypothetical protein
MRYILKDTKNVRVRQAEVLLEHTQDYNTSQKVKDIIRDLYNGCCAYCDCAFEEGAYYQLDHFYPKSKAKYKKYRKCIKNLHYSCQRCNNLKGAKDPHNILSPNYYLSNDLEWQMTSREKINDELIYVGHLLFSINKNTNSIDRGLETIKMFNLNNTDFNTRGNRSFLVECRIKTFASVYHIIAAIYSLLVNYYPKNNDAIETLFKVLIPSTYESSHFSNMIIHNFGTSIIQLLSVYCKLKCK